MCSDAVISHTHSFPALYWYGCYVCGFGNLPVDCCLLICNYCHVLSAADRSITCNCETSKKTNNSEAGEADKTVQKQKVSVFYFSSAIRLMPLLHLLFFS